MDNKDKKYSNLKVIRDKGTLAENKSLAIEA